MRAVTAGVVGSALVLAFTANARIIELDLTLDSRQAFAIEDFGFQEGGQLKLEVNNFKVTSAAFPSRVSERFRKLLLRDDVRFWETQPRDGNTKCAFCPNMQPVMQMAVCCGVQIIGPAGEATRGAFLFHRVSFS
jgi:hypothetical protein